MDRDSDHTVEWTPVTGQGRSGDAQHDARKERNEPSRDGDHRIGELYGIARDEQAKGAEGFCSLS